MDMNETSRRKQVYFVIFLVCALEQKYGVLSEIEERRRLASRIPDESKPWDMVGISPTDRDGIYYATVRRSLS